MKISNLAILFCLALTLTACAPTPAPETPPAAAEPAIQTQAQIPTEIPDATDMPLPTETSAPSPTPLPPTPTEELPIDWDQAIDFIGQIKTVCGPVRSAYFATASNGQPTFLNIGREYPDPTRFSVLIWGDDRGNFPAPPEEAYTDQTICATGEIEEYDGIAEIVVEDPSQITRP